MEQSVQSLQAGTQAKMFIGQKWHACIIDRIDDVPHSSGQRMRRFKCVFADGSIICCGRNSIKAKDSP